MTTIFYSRGHIVVRRMGYKSPDKAMMITQLDSPHPLHGGSRPYIVGRDCQHHHHCHPENQTTAVTPSPPSPSTVLSSSVPTATSPLGNSIASQSFVYSSTDLPSSSARSVHSTGKHSASTLAIAITLGIIGPVILLCGLIFIFRYLKKRKRRDEEKADRAIFGSRENSDPSLDLHHEFYPGRNEDPPQVPIPQFQVQNSVVRHSLAHSAPPVSESALSYLTEPEMGEHTNIAARQQAMAV
ncbi:hypothetical protein GALMADRAFT_747503 [Galerina marginata CBS 339.88]|uniref:Mid2 domain-containing protein n=1 Tax=Galerina marginata (strain CBS 339.88) TaxID=685588 RepID=A0A067SZG8_GALM3|nr:hypothetical protein GALMADRAFT_747503 [Galerina marginata CBS 339.88]